MTKEKHSDGDVRPSYKETLNLLHTSFGMRANAIQREPEIQRFWAKNGIDFKLGLANNGSPFTLHDGPPYANGPLHMGHALNKVLKDIINKYQLMLGHKVHFVPGWDCHGLPIELKVLQSIDNEERKRLSPLKLRKKASVYARKQVKNQMEGFRRWGIWGDWENSYLTLQHSYEAAQVNVFGQMALAGHIYRGLKPVHWSPSSKTALAEAELEYPDGHVSKSIYVGFSATELPDKLILILLEQGLSFPSEKNKLSEVLKIAIWTTTPWTIPANIAVSVNANLDYVFAADSHGSFIIIANELLDVISEKLGLALKVVAKVKGSNLEGILYKHPLIDRNGSVVIGGDYITTESGTGLVHTAPGHGVDDFNTALKYNLPVLCIVDDKGFLTADAGQFQGLNVLHDANSQIIHALDMTGYLFHEEDYPHRYPYDWRTKKPTIFRATEQWFASVAGFREDALLAIKSVEWLPSAGRNRIEAMVKERGDWCISRQRTWGVPIPVFYERDGNNILLNSDTINHIESLFAKHGADIWWEKDEVDLLPPRYSSEADKWVKSRDTMDVWFDSGSSWSAVISQREHLSCPADIYLEGTDQHRGWFQSSLLTSVAVKGKAPYKKVITHGFVLDDKGRKMSKSLGNVLDPAMIIGGGVNKKLNPAYGADVLRLWVSSVDYSVDVQIGPTILRQISDVYRKVRNTARYLLGNLHDFDPEHDAIPIEDLPILDKWMLNKTADVIDEISKSYEDFEFSRFFQLLQSFCVVDLSSFYLDIAKDRLYVSAPSDRRRRSCQTVMALIVERLAGILAPVLCHMAEDIWQNIPYYIAENSVFQRGWPTVPDNWRNHSLNEYVNQLRILRTSVNRVLEECRNKNQLGAGLEASLRIEPRSNLLQDAITWLEKNGDLEVDIIRDWLLVSGLQIGGEPLSELLFRQESEIALIEVARAPGSKCQRCWHYELDVGKDSSDYNLCGRCIEVINKL